MQISWRPAAATPLIWLRGVVWEKLLWKVNGEGELPDARNRAAAETFHQCLALGFGHPNRGVASRFS